MARRLAAVLRWLLLPAALILALAGMFAVRMAPLWIPWEYRLLITNQVGETGYRLLWLPPAIALLAWLLRRGHARLTIATLAGCLAAFALLATPAAQAWWLGRMLPARLAAAFGPAAPDRAPFSVAALFADPPAPVAPKEGFVAPGLGLDFYRAVGRAPAPCIVVLHGGGWVGGGHRDRRPYTAWLARHGYAVATIDYGLVPQDVWPAQRRNVLTAIAVLRTHATGLGIDPQKFVLLGRSAGGQLAEATAYAARDPGIRGVIAFYGPSDLRFRSGDLNGGDMNFRLRGWTAEQIVAKYLGGTESEVPAAYAAASAITLVGPASPPTLLIHGRLDSLVPVAQSARLATRLTAAGRPNLLLELPWDSHAFDTLNFDGPGTQLSTYAIAWFLESVTR